MVVRQTTGMVAITPLIAAGIIFVSVIIAFIYLPKHHTNDDTI